MASPLLATFCSRRSRSRPRLVFAIFALAAGGLLARGEMPLRAQAHRPRKADAARPRSAPAGTVQDTTQYPWSSVCKIIATFPNDTTVEGSGTMIGPHHCLTALHLIYDTATKTKAKRVQIIPGYDDERLLSRGLSSHPFGTAHINEFLFWEPQDIAVVVTSTNIGKNSSWMTPASRSDRELRNESYTLAGYTGIQEGSGRQKSGPVSVGRVEGDRVRLETGGAASMVGGPICLRTAKGRPGQLDAWSIVGVQTGPSVGVRIPPDMKKILDRFLHDDFAGVGARIPIPLR